MNFGKTINVARYSRLGDITAKLMKLSKNGTSHYLFKDLPSLIPEDSLLVINNAATIPGSFWTVIHGKDIEIRIVQIIGSDWKQIDTWQVLLLGRGSWQDRTEDRGDIPQLQIGERFRIGQLQVVVENILDTEGKLLQIKVQDNFQKIWNTIYQYGNPIQYSHLRQQLQLWDVQTIFSSIPIAMEPASASFQFTWDLLQQLKQKGVEFSAITHGTSISSTGSQLLDQQLPFSEPYWISQNSADSINRAYEEYRPIIAVGTSVTRALEDNHSQFNMIRPGNYVTNLKITKNYQLKIVRQLITGMHLPHESHIELLQAFIEENLLDRAYLEAINHDYLWHEYGDLCLIVSD